MIEPIDYSILTQKPVLHSVTSGPDQVGETRKVAVRKDDRGFTHLTCPCLLFARTAWCDHVESLYRNDEMMDKVIEWSPAIVVFRMPVWLIIPTLVVPEREDTESPFFRVDVLWGDPKRTGKEYEAKGGETLGFIGRYERRRAIRNLLLEWLPALLYRTEAINCTSNLHSRGNSLLDLDNKRCDYNQQDDVTKRRMLMDAYNILDTGSCGACYTSANIPF